MKSIPLFVPHHLLGPLSTILSCRPRVRRRFAGLYEKSFRRKRPRLLQAIAKLYTAFDTTKGISGAGLGLWVSSEIVQRRHGTLSVRSRQGEKNGTVVTLSLPYQAIATEYTVLRAQSLKDTYARTP